MITRLELNSLNYGWEVHVHIQTEQELETVAKFAEEQGLREVVKLRNHAVCVIVPTELVSKFCTNSTVPDHTKQITVTCNCCCAARGLDSSTVSFDTHSMRGDHGRHSLSPRRCGPWSAGPSPEHVRR